MQHTFVFKQFHDVRWITYNNPICLTSDSVTQLSGSNMIAAAAIVMLMRTNSAYMS